MVFKSLSRRLRPRLARSKIPDGERIYAVGDVHGRLDLLDPLLAMIRADDAQRAPAKTQIIFLGDLIDRGPSSAQVVERARRLESEPVACRFLMGNHEEVFLQALGGDLKALSFFNRIGGRETILSYGISEQEYLEADYAELLALLQARVPAEHKAFLERFEDLIVIGDYAFVHAGIHPERPLAEQKLGDLRWIRREFLEHRGTLEKMIVHGHTVSDEVEQLPHRVGLDTGAFASGKLSAIGFESDGRWLLESSL